ncbi:glycosyl hydrolase family 95 catalytic domain-containing protein [Microbacterium soli]|uniref:Glycoside hydrolase N-terminal domain-containing protein n=1 Tax=Microbacterium soli TaxID=446075 RepID=A0ABP7MTX4_9MICO
MRALRYRGRARTWLECLPLGDGRLGAMTDGGVSSTTIHLNDATAWSGSPHSEAAHPLPDAARCSELLSEARAAIAGGDPVGAEAPLQAMQTSYAQSFVPLGSVVITTETAPDDSQLTRELDIGTGLHTSTTSAHRTTTFIAPEQSVLVHTIEPAAPVSAVLSSPLHGPGAGDAPLPVDVDTHTSALLLRLPSDVAPGHEPDLPGAVWSTQEGAALRAALVARVLHAPERTVVMVAAATTYTAPGRPPTGDAHDALQSALARLDAAQSQGADALRQHARTRMRDALDGVDLSFRPDHSELDTASRLARARTDPAGMLARDPDLAALLFHYGRYLLVSSSRPGGLPATLQGIWNAEMRPPWGSAYTVNINTQMNYWGAHVTGLSAAAEALSDFTLALSEAAAAHTSRLYGAPGWTVHHNTDAWLYSTSPGRGSGDPRWAFWPMGGAWLASMLTEPWEFGAAGAAELARIWPALRGAATFALSWHRDGRTSPSTSPENAYLLDDGRAASLASTSTMDLSLVRMVLERTVRAAQALELADDEVAAAAAARLSGLARSPAVTADGRIVEWDVARTEEDPHHRHMSHLLGLFPGTEDWSPRARAAAAATLERRGDDSSGWSLVWKLALWARLGDEARTGRLIEMLLRDAQTVSGPWAGGLYPNLFAAHPPFQIDANLGYVGALAECLLQSHRGIVLLPALPRQLGDGCVRGLIARPGIIVDLEWADGELVEARLRARRAEAAGVHRVLWRGRAVSVEIGMEETVLLQPGDFPSRTPRA